MTIAMGLDIFLAILLIIAIAYCYRLEMRLRALRSGRDGMLEAARELAQSTLQAQQAIAGLRESSSDAGKALQQQIDEAKELTRVMAGSSPRGPASFRCPRRFDT